MKEYRIKNANATMRYHDLPGEDIPILFIHGLGCAGSFDYPEVAAQPELQHHRRIIIDLLGAGFSDRPEDFGYAVDDHAAYLQEFVQDIGLASFVLYGHSLGGAVSISLAARCPERVHRLILSESNLEKSGNGAASKMIADFGLEAFLESGFEKIVEINRRHHGGIWAASLSLCLPRAVYLLSKCAAEGVSPSWRELLFSLQCPRAFICGEFSLPYPRFEELRANGVHMEIVPQAGHGMAWDNPRGLAQAIQSGMHWNGQRAEEKMV